MKKSLIIFFALMYFQSFSQERENQFILFNYSYQFPINNLLKTFGNNSSIGLSYLKNKNKLIYGIDANFMFGNNIKNDSLLQSISTEDGYLINASGELDEVLLYQRGMNTHILLGRSFSLSENNPTGLYLYGGIGYLYHKIRLESDRTNLPQISDNYIKGYDNFTHGLSSKICLDYMYFDKNTFMKFYIGTEFINAITKNNRPYNFGEMKENDFNLQLDQLLGIRFGIIIPINRNNEGDFYYR